MRTLKDLAIFLTGGFAACGLISYSLKYNAQYPREDCVIYENEDVKVIRQCVKKHYGYDIATVVYKH